MRNHKAILTLATGLALAATQAAAVVSIDNPDNATVWVKELKVDDAGPILYANNQRLDLVVNAGFGFPQGVTRYIRIDMDSNAKFTVMPTCTVINGNRCTLRTGGAYQSYATYKYEANAAPVEPNDLITLSYDYDPANPRQGLAFVEKAKVTVTYSLHNNDVSVDTGLSGTGLLHQKTSDYLRFEDSVTASRECSACSTSSAFSNCKLPPLFADVNTGYRNFTLGYVAGVLGRLAYQFVPGYLTVKPYPNPTYNDFATVTDVVAQADLRVDGDFTATQDVDTDGLPAGTYTSAPVRTYLSTNSDCSTVSSPANEVAADHALFTVPTTGDYYICMKPNGNVPMNPGKYSATLSMVPQTGYLSKSWNLPEVGEICRNGTVLDTPYFTITPGYISRIYLNNSGSMPAVYEGYAITDTGETVQAGPTLRGEIPPYSNLMLFFDPERPDATAILGHSSTTRKRGAIRFVVAAENKSIQGVYQTINKATVEVQSVVMMRAGGGNGQ